MKIYITRHGQTEWNTERRIQGNLDSPLTEIGLEGAKKLHERLKNIEFDSIITSPLFRALKTSEIIKGSRDIELIKEDSLKEINCGDFEGYTFDEIWKKNPHFKIELDKDPYNFKYPNGESLKEFYERVTKGFKKLLKKYENRTILIVAHGGTIKCITSYIFENESANLWFKNVVENCSLTEIDYLAGEFSVVKYNDSKHLTKIEKEAI